MSIIVGVNGYGRSGKDELARVLVDNYGFERIAFADVLRCMAYAVDPLVSLSWQTDVPGVSERATQRLSEVVDSFGWDYAKTTFPDVRRLLQRLGTEGGRNALGENVWVDAAFDRAKSDKLVITDMRFPNELRAVTERNGVTVRVNRAGNGPANDHPSETSLDNYKFDYYLDNDGTLGEFQRKAHVFAQGLDAGRADAVQ